MNGIVLPRRQMIGCGLAAVAMADCARAQSQGFEPLPAKVEIKDRQLTTAVRVNGRGPFHFVVDTGADHSVIAADVAEALKLTAGREVVVQGIIGSVSAPSVPIRELRFGPVVCENLDVPVLPRALLKVDGYLGLDAIGRNRVVFDFAHHTLQVTNSVPLLALEPAGGDTLIPAPGDAGHLRSLSCRVDQVFATAFLDSGAEVSVGNEALRRKLQDGRPGYTGERDIELTGITGGMRTGRVVKVDTILLGNLEFSGCEIAIADLDIFRIWGLADTPALLIGLNFLREFQTVTIDYGRKEFRLKLTSSEWVNRKQA